MTERIRKMKLAALAECMRTRDRYLDCLYRQVLSLPNSVTIYEEDYLEIEMIKKDWTEFDRKMNEAGLR